MIKMAIQALAALIKDLARLDRYERRALSRRRTAVQRLDDLRAAEARPDTEAPSGAAGGASRRASSRVGVGWPAAL